MTRALANELGQYSINVNSIAPGFTLTDASNTAYPPEEIEQRKENIRNSRSIKRDEQPNDLAGTAVFLASDDSDFITGTSIPVNGGEVMF
jgi:NAD(P)-dependent dehydrogenase (short-subunit alcohol dehydrogenase family)